MAVLGDGCCVICRKEPRAEDAKLTCANYLSPAGARRRGRRRRRRHRPVGPTVSTQ